MEKKIGPVKAYFVNDKTLPNCSITMGFKYKCNWFVLQKLMRGQPCSCLELAYASENTCIAYTIYEVIKEKLMGSPLEQSKSKISTMQCNYQNGEFFITFNCPNNIPVIKKILMIAMSKISPHKYYAKYSHNIKLLNGKPFKNEFLYVCNLMKGFTVQIFIIGKFNINLEKISDIVTKVSEKYVHIKEVSGSEKPSSLNKNQGNTDYPFNTAEGYRSIFVKDFIKSESGLPAVINSGQVIVYNKKWNVLSKKINSTIVKKYTIQKYAKLKDNLIPIVLYMISSECSLDTDNLIKLHKDNPSHLTIAAWITKALDDISKPTF